MLDVAEAAVLAVWCGRHLGWVSVSVSMRADAKTPKRVWVVTQSGWLDIRGVWMGDDGRQTGARETQ